MQHFDVTTSSRTRPTLKGDTFLLLRFRDANGNGIGLRGMLVCWFARGPTSMRRQHRLYFEVTCKFFGEAGDAAGENTARSMYCCRFALGLGTVCRIRIQRWTNTAIPVYSKPISFII